LGESDHAPWVDPQERLVQNDRPHRDVALRKAIVRDGAQEWLLISEADRRLGDPAGDSLVAESTAASEAARTPMRSRDCGTVSAVVARLARPGSR